MIVGLDFLRNSEGQEFGKVTFLCRSCGGLCFFGITNGNSGGRAGLVGEILLCRGGYQWNLCCICFNMGKIICSYCKKRREINADRIGKVEI